MSDAVGLKSPIDTLEEPFWKPLDRAVWRAWKAKGRARDRRDHDRHIKALTWISIVALLAVAAFWSHLSPYETGVRWVLTAAAVGMAGESFNKRQYALGAIFAGIALLYSPIVSPFSFSGAWQRGFVIASAVPFVASSLAWSDMKGGPR